MEPVNIGEWLIKNWTATARRLNYAASGEAFPPALPMDKEHDRRGNGRSVHRSGKLDDDQAVQTKNGLEKAAEGMC